jgi:hypothetical protein
VPLSDGDIRIFSLIVAPAVSDLGDSAWNQRFRLDLSTEVQGRLRHITHNSKSSTTDNVKNNRLNLQNTAPVLDPTDTGAAKLEIEVKEVSSGAPPRASAPTGYSQGEQYPVEFTFGSRYIHSSIHRTRWIPWLRMFLVR